jgi:hypothetical protein
MKLIFTVLASLIVYVIGVALILMVSIFLFQNLNYWISVALGLPILCALCYKISDWSTFKLPYMFIRSRSTRSGYSAIVILSLIDVSAIIYFSFNNLYVVPKWYVITIFLFLLFAAISIQKTISIYTKVMVQ